MPLHQVQVSQVQVGEPVQQCPVDLAAAVGGSYREYALLGQAVAKPEALSWEVAASLVTVGQTAYRVLEQLGVPPT
ncbi:hypothetical protein [Streptomyces silvisoli]|uniref:Uncharacterized protein n=1 Tax=Streptomyces silvisoli TaxID=3034235 RepID=A0ABT5ZXU8_9ACTN|nr:hypothetical protein [Streptomyces silvisoli]MDF3294354.1 hypothetical protein [Streptomyces silvisoli]